MKKQKTIMGMPVTINICDANAKEEGITSVLSYLHFIDEAFSTYKKTSEITKINDSKLLPSGYSNEMKKILALSEQTKQQTNGYFDIENKGKLDPSGIVKGYAIFNASKLLERFGYKNFYVEIAGDIEVRGKNKQGENWLVGIRNPFQPEEIMKRVSLTNKGIATSGNYIRGNHIYNPLSKSKQAEIASLTVIGSNVYEADRFATAAFAMGKIGIHFIESLKGFEGYMVTFNKIATYTTGFEKYVTN